MDIRASFEVLWHLSMSHQDALPRTRRVAIWPRTKQLVASSCVKVPSAPTRRGSGWSTQCKTLLHLVQYSIVLSHTSKLSIASILWNASQWPYVAMCGPVGYPGRLRIINDHNTSTNAAGWERISERWQVQASGQKLAVEVLVPHP